MAEKQVRIGFIGCGGIANWHFGHMEKNPKARVVATCDLIEERANKAAAKFRAKPYLDYRKMLEKERLDAVYVCVEPCAHKGMELLAIEKGCHLFVQKPVALNMAYANKVRKALAKSGLVNAVGFQLRYLDILPRMRAWLEMQEIVMFNAYYVGGMPTVWWWRRRETSGGQIVEQTIHSFDMLRYIFGDVTTVQAIGRKGLMGGVENYDTEDGSAVNLTFESGVIGTVFSACCVDHAGKYGIDVYCKNGRLEWSWNDFKIVERNMTVQGSAGNDNGQDIDNAFIDAILTGDRSLILTDYADACKTLEVTLAANRSLDSGGQVVVL